MTRLYCGHLVLQANVNASPISHHSTTTRCRRQSSGAPAAPSRAISGSRPMKMTPGCQRVGWGSTSQTNGWYHG